MPAGQGRHGRWQQRVAGRLRGCSCCRRRSLRCRSSLFLLARSGGAMVRAIGPRDPPLGRAGDHRLRPRWSPACAADWRGCRPMPRQRIYFANHVSHGDFVLIWSVLPRGAARAHPAGRGADYWRAARCAASSISEVFRGVLIDRGRRARGGDPLQPMLEALDAGRFADPLPGRHAQHRATSRCCRSRAASITWRRARPAGRAGAGVDRQPQPRDAQGRVPAGAAAVHASPSARRSRSRRARTKTPSSSAPARRCWPWPRQDAPP